MVESLGNQEARLENSMKLIAKVVVALMLATAAYGAQDVVSAVHGTIDKIDSGTKTWSLKLPMVLAARCTCSIGQRFMAQTFRLRRRRIRGMA
jgi:hypothetical protein